MYVCICMYIYTYIIPAWCNLFEHCWNKIKIVSYFNMNTVLQIVLLAAFAISQFVCCYI